MTELLAVHEGIQDDERMTALCFHSPTGDHGQRVDGSGALVHFTALLHPWSGME